MTAAAPDKAGRLRGALEIMLKPGWKTYWRDPGTAGVPPTIDVPRSTNVSAATLDFPAPERHDDGYGAWAGYAAPVRFAVTFTLPDPNAPALIDADVFLGLCREICVPVSARFSLDAAGKDADEETAAVEAAFAGLPAPARSGFGVHFQAIDGDSMVLSAEAPKDAGAPPELFVAGENGFAFGVPRPEKAAGGWRFVVPLLDRPAVSDQAPVFYTLKAGKDAVSGTFTLP